VAPSKQVDDVAFARSMVDYTVKNMCGDSTNVFAIGFSNGGMMSNRLGCQAADLFKAIGPVAGNIKTNVSGLMHQAHMFVYVLSLFLPHIFVYALQSRRVFCSRWAHSGLASPLNLPHGFRSVGIRTACATPISCLLPTSGRSTTGATFATGPLRRTTPPPPIASSMVVARPRQSTASSTVWAMNGRAGCGLTGPPQRSRPLMWMRQPSSSRSSLPWQGRASCTHIACETESRGLPKQHVQSPPGPVLHQPISHIAALRTAIAMLLW
jgi:hypothetical protein